MHLDMSVIKSQLWSTLTEMWEML